MILSIFLDGAYEDHNIFSSHKFKISKKAKIPLLEISGLYKFPESQGKEIYAIGDREAKLAIISLQDDKLEIKSIIDFSESIINRFGVCKSLKIPGCKKHLKHLTTQWEAVTSDRSKKAYLLHEQFATIFVLDVMTKQIVNLINLESFEEAPAKKREPVNVDKENAMGEGLILLKNGHILAIKERFPPSLVEFGKADTAAEGYYSDIWVGDRYDFPLEAEIFELVPLKIWQMEKQYRNCDLSELSADDQGTLYLISQQCQWIAQLTDPSPEADIATIEIIGGLPRGIKKAESFVIFNKQKVWVAEDSQSQHNHNIFLLTKMEKAKM